MAAKIDSACAVMLGLLSLLLVRPVCARSLAPGMHALPLTIEAGVPLHVLLEDRVRIKHVGAPVRGRLAEPIYVFDRIVVPAGTEVEGRVTRIDPVPKRERAMAIMDGDFTPLRTAHIEFDTLILKDGRRLPLRTVVSQRAMSIVHLEAKGTDNSSKKGKVGQTVAQTRQRVKSQEQQVIQEIKAPGKLQRVKAALVAELPYHRQTLPRGMSFIAELQSPVTLGTKEYPSGELKTVGSPVPRGSLVYARLVSPLSSATIHVGAPVKAVVTRPLFSADHHLILPQGTSLEGVVTQAQPARRFDRNGKLRFVFREIELPSKVKQAVVADLEGVEVDRAANLKLDSEGAAHAVTPKTNYIAPAIDVVLATSSLDGLDGHRRELRLGKVRGPDFAGGAVRGGAGFGLVGTLLGLAAHSRAISSGFAFYGAGWSVYSHIVERGQDVIFPKDTPLEIRVHGRP
ncbi:MAG: hypothetical protein ACRD1O_08685 [Terriglobia bacterium]